MRRAVCLAVLTLASCNQPSAAPPRQATADPIGGEGAAPADGPRSNTKENTGLVEILQMVGGSETKNSHEGNDEDALVLDGPTVIRQIPNLQGIGLLNPDISSTTAAISGEAIPVGMCLQVSTVALIQAYKTNPKLDQVSFSCSISEPDDYGHASLHRVFGFQFDRAHFRRVDWDHFEFVHLPRIAPAFAYTRWAMNQLALLS